MSQISEPCADCVDGHCSGNYKPPSVPPRREKFCYIGAPAVFSLEQVCATVSRAFGDDCCYVVGSCLERPDFRDVDVRLIIGDKKFETLFGAAGNAWEYVPFWQLLVVSISEFMSKRTGLPIDFQVQSMSLANGPPHKGKPRQPVGLICNERPAWTKIDLLDK